MKDKARLSNHRTNWFVRLFSAARRRRRQIGAIVVAAAMGLVIVLNVAMAPKTSSHTANAQVSYLKKETPQVRSLVQ